MSVFFFLWFLFPRRLSYQSALWLRRKFISNLGARVQAAGVSSVADDTLELGLVCEDGNAWGDWSQARTAGSADSAVVEGYFPY